MLWVLAIQCLLWNVCSNPVVLFVTGECVFFLSYTGLCSGYKSYLVCSAVNAFSVYGRFFLLVSLEESNIFNEVQLTYFVTNILHILSNLLTPKSRKFSCPSSSRLLTAVRLVTIGYSVKEGCTVPVCHMTTYLFTALSPRWSTFPPLYHLGTFVKNQLTTCMWVYFGLLFSSLDLNVYIYHTSQFLLIHLEIR